MTAKLDVFISHIAVDRSVADRTARRLISSGINVRLYQHPTSGAAFSDVIWSAIHKSDIFVVVLSRASIAAPSTSLELGFALGRHKPVFLLTYRLRPADIPQHLSKIPRYRFGDVARLCRDVAHSYHELSPPDDAVLRRLYAEFRVPTDMFLRDASALEALTARFNRETGKQCSPEYLLEHMIRMRKRGAWVRLQKTARSASLRIKGG